MPAPDEQQIVITDNRDERRYEIRARGELAGFSEYSREPNVLTFLHTEIDPAFEGRGLGSKLAAAALDDARAQHAQVIPLCPFIAAYIAGHPGYDEIVAPPHGAASRRYASTRAAHVDNKRPPGRPYISADITVYYDRARCRHFAECVRGLPEVFDVREKPWIRADRAAAERIAEVVRRCPIGALHYVGPGAASEQPEEPTTVRALPEGPLLLRGDLLIATPAGDRREMRAAVCGCGASSEIAPLCDGSCGINVPG